MNQHESRPAIRAVLNHRRLLELVKQAVETTLDAGECPRCDVEAVAIQVILRRSGRDFRIRRITVHPEYGPAPLDGAG